MSSVATQGVVEELPFRAINFPAHGKNEAQFYVLNVNKGEIRPISKKILSSDLRNSSVVFLGSCIYIIGGFRMCGGKFINNNVFYLDSSSFNGSDDLLSEHPCYVGPPPILESVWIKGLPMLSNLYFQKSVVLDGKIYVVGRSGAEGFSVEVFDSSQNIWSTASDSPNPNLFNLSPPILADPCGRRILVHDFRTNSLHAYSIDDKEWKCLNEKYDGGEWCVSSVFADGVIYSLSSYEDEDFEVGEKKRKRSWSSGIKCNLQAYDVDEKKPLSIKWSPFFLEGMKWSPLPEEEELEVPCTAGLFHLGFDKFCLAWDCMILEGIRYIKFSVRKNSTVGKILAIPELMSFIPCKGCASFVI